MQLLDDLKETRRYWKLKIALFGELSLEEAIDLSGDRQILDLTLRSVGEWRYSSMYS
jgi:hypothetical protein